MFMIDFFLYGLVTDGVLVGDKMIDSGKDAGISAGRYF